MKTISFTPTPFNSPPPPPPPPPLLPHYIEYTCLIGQNILLESMLLLEQMRKLLLVHPLQQRGVLAGHFLGQLGLALAAQRLFV